MMMVHVEVRVVEVSKIVVQLFMLKRTAFGRFLSFLLLFLL